MNPQRSALFWYPYLFPALCALMLCYTPASAQKLNTTEDSVRLHAGNYQRSAFYQWLWGKHYRKDWATDVSLPVVYLDTLFGGLTPYKAGGGRQSKTLRLHDTANREYVIRSIDKSFGKALPELLQNTFVEDFVDDQVSIAQPYAAVTIADLAKAAGIYHTIPSIIYLPHQEALDSFDAAYGNTAFLLEQRPDEDWHIAGNFGNSENIVGTDKMLEKTIEKRNDVADQKAFVRARLFDMLIGDWGRHEDQWRWATFDSANLKIYRPIPRDRDQAYTLFDGVLLQKLIHVADLQHLHSFNQKIKNIPEYNFPARNLDRRLTNGVAKEYWTATAAALVRALTDSVIEAAVAKLPPEIYRLSGKNIINGIEKRRAQLPEYAEKYYRFLAKEADVPATEHNDYFLIERLDDNATRISIYTINEDGTTDPAPYFQRVFKREETDEVRLYGINGNDVFKTTGTAKAAVKIRLIGGPLVDSFLIHPDGTPRGHTFHIYDDPENILRIGKSVRTHLKDDSAIHAYDYASFQYGRSKFVSGVAYNNADRLYLKAGYEFINRKWRKEPYGNSQGIYLGYSLTQNAFSVLYRGDFRHVVGKLDAHLQADYDAVRWLFFYGFGNETFNTGNKQDYRIRTTELLLRGGISRDIGAHQRIGLSGIYQGVKLLSAGVFSNNNFDVLAAKSGDAFQHFAGGELSYRFQDVDEPVAPTCGLELDADIALLHELSGLQNTFTRSSAGFRLYVPLPARFVFMVQGSGTSISGSTEFYQYPAIGGNQTLRGYSRDRFRGKTAVFVNNELRWLPFVKTYLFNGKAGLLGLYDLGRVWMPGTMSDKMHYAWGGGVMIVPFNKIMISVTYAISEENRMVHFRLGKSF